MNSSQKTILVIFLISLVFGFAGLVMTIDSYYRHLSVEEAENQIEFFRSMPALLSDGSSLKLPAFRESSVFGSNRNFSGTCMPSLYDNNTSIMKVSVKICRAPFSCLEFNPLIDTRIRR